MEDNLLALEVSVVIFVHDDARLLVGAKTDDASSASELFAEFVKRCVWWITKPCVISLASGSREGIDIITLSLR
jgi:hypothetical protein